MFVLRHVCWYIVEAAFISECLHVDIYLNRKAGVGDKLIALKHVCDSSGCRHQNLPRGRHQSLTG